MFSLHGVLVCLGLILYSIGSKAIQAWIALDPIEYKIRPKHTNTPCKENIALL